MEGLAMHRDNPYRRIRREIEEYAQSEVGKLAGCTARCGTCPNEGHCPSHRRAQKLLREAGGNPYYWETPWR